jgi:hypothetical protein
LYLVVLAALWISAFQDYFTAAQGITADGTPTGNLAYAAVCFAVAALAVYSVSTKGDAQHLFSLRRNPSDSGGVRSSPDKRTTTSPTL